MLVILMKHGEADLQALSGRNKARDRAFEAELVELGITQGKGQASKPVR